MASRRGYLAFGSVLAVSGVVAALGFLASVVTARTLTPEERGVLLAAILWVGNIGWLATAGIDDALLISSQGRLESLKVSLASTSRYSLATALAGAASVLLVVLIAMSGGTSRLPLVALMAATCVPLTVVAMRWVSIPRVQLRYGSFNVARALPTLIYSVGIVLLALVSRLNPESGMSTFLAGNVLVVLYLWVGRRRLGSILRPGANWTSRGRGVATLGLKSLALAAPTTIGGRTDQLLISVMLASATYSYYAAAVAVTVPITLVGASFALFLLPELASRDVASRRALGVRSILMGLLLLGVVAIPLGIAAEWLLGSVFGAAYSASAQYARVLILGSVFLSLSMVPLAMLRVEQRFRYVTVLQWGLLLLAACAQYMAIPIYGALGAAIIGTVAAGISLAIALSLAFSKQRPPAEVQ